MVTFNFPVMLNYFQSVDTNFNYHQQYKRVPTSSHRINHVVFKLCQSRRHDMESDWDFIQVFHTFMAIEYFFLCKMQARSCLFLLSHKNSLCILDIKLLLVLHIIIFFPDYDLSVFTLLWCLLMKEFLDFTFNLILHDFFVKYFATINYSFLYFLLKETYIAFLWLR